MASINNGDFKCNWDGRSYDPVHQHEDGLWFWYDETWCDEFGPYLNEEFARADLKKYCTEVLGV